MKIEAATTLSPLYYFLAGALLPTIAYTFLQRFNRDDVSSAKIGDLGFDDDDSDGYGDGNTNASAASQSGSENLFDNPLDELNRVDPSKWGMTDIPYKMVLCVNTSLGMGKGKIAAQCCHAAVGCYKRAKKNCPAGLRAWEVSGCAKIAVKCPSEDEMMNDILIKAKRAGIPYYFVEDAGRTQIAAGSRTVLGLGPAPVKMFEDITSHLKLM